MSSAMCIAIVLLHVAVESSRITSGKFEGRDLGESKRVIDRVHMIQTSTPNENGTLEFEWPTDFEKQWWRCLKQPTQEWAARCWEWQMVDYDVGVELSTFTESVTMECDFPLEDCLNESIESVGSNVKLMDMIAGPGKELYVLSAGKLPIAHAEDIFQALQKGNPNLMFVISTATKKQLLLYKPLVGAKPISADLDGFLGFPRVEPVDHTMRDALINYCSNKFDVGFLKSLQGKRGTITVLPKFEPPTMTCYRPTSPKYRRKGENYQDNMWRPCICKSQKGSIVMFTGGFSDYQRHYTSLLRQALYFQGVDNIRIEVKAPTLEFQREFPSMTGFVCDLIRPDQAIVFGHTEQIADAMKDALVSATAKKRVRFIAKNWIAKGWFSSFIVKLCGDGGYCREINFISVKYSFWGNSLHFILRHALQCLHNQAAALEGVDFIYAAKQGTRMTEEDIYETIFMPDTYLQAWPVASEQDKALKFCFTRRNPLKEFFQSQDDLYKNAFKIQVGPHVGIDTVPGETRLQHRNIDRDWKDHFKAAVKITTGETHDKIVSIDDEKTFFSAATHVSLWKPSEADDFDRFQSRTYSSMERLDSGPRPPGDEVTCANVQDGLRVSNIHWATDFLQDSPEENGKFNLAIGSGDDAKERKARILGQISGIILDYVIKDLPTLGDAALQSDTVAKIDAEIGEKSGYIDKKTYDRWVHDAIIKLTPKLKTLHRSLPTVQRLLPSANQPIRVTREKVFLVAIPTRNLTDMEREQVWSHNKSDPRWWSTNLGWSQRAFFADSSETRVFRYRALDTGGREYIIAGNVSDKALVEKFVVTNCKEVGEENAAAKVFGAWMDILKMDKKPGLCLYQLGRTHGQISGCNTIPGFTESRVQRFLIDVCKNEVLFPSSAETNKEFRLEWRVDRDSRFRVLFRAGNVRKSSEWNSSFKRMFANGNNMYYAKLSSDDDLLAVVCDAEPQEESNWTSTCDIHNNLYTRTVQQEYIPWSR